MVNHQPDSILAFHSCDLKVGIKILLGLEDLKQSNNAWDWLADGVYFWEQNPHRALEYAIESSKNEQFNKVQIQIPFVIGAIIDLKNCLNLTETQSLGILKNAYSSYKTIRESVNKPLLQNRGANRILDCAIIRFIHETNNEKGLAAYDSVRGAFPEGDPVYPSSEIKERTHIQIAVRNPDCIKGYFLPKPLDEFNPFLKKHINVSFLEKLSEL
ncbi:MAG: hypothetical protein QM541_01375 [Flavobacterium sp.]|nr:hypothetical protein [Flavobacterium sp.]